MFLLSSPPSTPVSCTRPLTLSSFSLYSLFLSFSLHLSFLPLSFIRSIIARKSVTIIDGLCPVLRMSSKSQATSAQLRVSDLICPYITSKGQEENIVPLSSPSSDDESNAYALHGFVATMEGQLSVIRGNKLLVMDDGNAYWWLVKRLDTFESGYVPAENIEVMSIHCSMVEYI